MNIELNDLHGEPVYSVQLSPEEFDVLHQIAARVYSSPFTPATVLTCSFPGVRMEWHLTEICKECGRRK